MTDAERQRRTLHTQTTASNNISNKSQHITENNGQKVNIHNLQAGVQRFQTLRTLNLYITYFYISCYLLTGWTQSSICKRKEILVNTVCDLRHNCNTLVENLMCPFQPSSAPLYLSCRKTSRCNANLLSEYCCATVALLPKSSTSSFNPLSVKKQHVQF